MGRVFALHRPSVVQDDRFFFGNGSSDFCNGQGTMEKKKKTQHTAILAVDVMNYPFTRPAQEKFWGSAEMAYMRQTVLGGKPLTEIFPDISDCADEFVGRMDKAGYEYVMVAALKMGSYRGKSPSLAFSADEVYQIIRGHQNRLIGLAGHDPLNIRERV